MAERFDIVQAYNDLNEGTISPETYLELHACMVRDGSAWAYPESFGRAASELIEAGFITPGGRITPTAYEAIAMAEEWYPSPLPTGGEPAVR